MPKGSFLSDTFEKLAELGGTTAKQTTKVAQQVVNPQKAFEQVTGVTTRSEEEVKRETERKKASTPLDLQKLEKSYEEQDKQKEEILRNRFFQLVKEGERGALAEAKREEEEKKRREEQELEEQKKKEQERLKSQDADSLPKGKERKSLFSPKKKAQAQHAETKPSGSKN